MIKHIVFLILVGQSQSFAGLSKEDIRQEALERLQTLRSKVNPDKQSRVEDRMLSTRWQMAVARNTAEAWREVATFAEQLSSKYGETEYRMMTSAQAFRRAGDNEISANKLSQARVRYGDKPNIVLTQGEVLFDLGKFEEARESYGALRKLKVTNKYRDFAALKMAWCDLNAGKSSQGLEILKELYSQTQEIAIKDETFNSFVLFYGMSDRASQEASSYFSFMDLQPKLDTLLKLAVAYDESGKFADSREITEFLLKKHRQDLKLGNLLVLSVKVNERTENFPVLAKRLDDLSEEMTHDKTLWETSRDLVKRITVKFHNRVVKSPNSTERDRSLPVVASAYKLISKENTGEHDGLLFEGAKLFWDQKNYEVSDGLFTSMKAFNEESLSSWIQLREDIFAKKGDKFIPQLVTAYDKGIQSELVKGPERLKVLIKKVAVCAKINGCEDELANFQEIYSKNAVTQETKVVLPLLQESLARKNDLATTIAFIEALKRPDGTLAEELRSIQVQAQLQIAENYQSKKEFEKAAETFASIKATGKTQCESLWNAHVNYERAGRTDQSMNLDWKGCETSPMNSRYVASMAEKLRSLALPALAVVYYQKIPEGQQIALNLRLRSEPELTKWTTADLSKALPGLNGETKAKAFAELMNREVDPKKKKKIAQEIVALGTQGQFNVMARMQLAKEIQGEFHQYKIRKNRPQDVAYVLQMKSKKMKEITELLSQIASDQDAQAIIRDVFLALAQDVAPFDEAASKQIETKMEEVLSQVQANDPSRSPASPSGVEL